MDAQDCYEFMRLLREKPDLAHADAWSVDWEKAPSGFKLYSGGARLRLHAPYAGLSNATAGQRLDRLLFYSFGCLVVQRSATSPSYARVRRAIASGGGLYPAEIYLHFRGGGRQYHYNPAAHELVGLGEVPDGDVMLGRALGLADSRDLRELVVIVALRFWKSYFKYGDFSYRLAATDAGVALGRVQRLAEIEYGQAVAHFDFDDRAINGMLGLDGREESAYALIAIGETVSPAPGLARHDRSAALPRSDGQVGRRSAMFDALHESVLAQAAQLVARKSSPGPPRPALRNTIAAATWLRGAIRRRRSLGERFTGAAVDRSSLLAVLDEAGRALARLRAASPDGDLPDLAIYCLVLYVAGVEPGAYCYRQEQAVFSRVAPGHWSAALQAAQRTDNINVDLSAFAVHFADRLDLRGSPRMNRAYRVQGMLAGAAMDAIMLASSAVGLASHPILGFRALEVDRLYGIAGSGRGTLAQVCVGSASCAGGIQSTIAF
jgi:SagB-type dehydrogenase family enzyme